jgi:UDP-2,4-diacetamido-2,4,6-trideoxy-beta-L-altropyranose hydrolase
MTSILFRTDAFLPLGTGHVLRCLALAQACTDAGWKVTFAMSATSLLRERITQEGMLARSVIANPGSDADAQETSVIAQECKATWIVVDGYHFGSAYQRLLKKAGHSVLFFDDYGHGMPYTADILLNPNTGADPALYDNRDAFSRLLLGERYALLRREFRQHAAKKRAFPECAHRLLVTFGGSDPGNATSLALQGIALLKPTENLSVRVIIGSANTHANEIQKSATACPFSVTCITNTTDMAGEMLQADLAITSGGTTSTELAFTGLPAIVVTIAENQIPVATALDKAGAISYLGQSSAISTRSIADALNTLISDRAKRQQMSMAGRSLIDGDGAERILLALSGAAVRLRTARDSDCNLLWEWANDPVSRSMSLTSDPIPWEEHCRWFEEKLQDSKCVFFLGFNTNDTAVGYVRFDGEDGDFVVSITVAPNARGKGIGTEILALALERLFRTTETGIVHAYVKPENDASIKIFQKAGFDAGIREKKADQDVLHFKLKRVTMALS